MQTTSSEFKANAASALRNVNLQKALAKTRTGFIDKRVAATDRLPEFDRLRDEARDIKNHTLAHLDLYLERFEEKVTACGGQVHWAETAADARGIVLDIIRAAGARTVTKGKSMISEEVGLNAHLEEAGVEVVETDLGEYIIQLRGETPSHIIAPAVHVTRDEVEADFREHHRHLPADRNLTEPESLVAEARKVLRQRYLDADVGITGANFLVAETGTSVIVTNEGNGDLTQSLARTHIVIASLEKVVPTLEDVSTILRILARSATGQEISTYTTFSSGPRRPGDPDGPESYHVVLLDNGRSGLLGGPFQEALRCIRCGACMNHCPIYQTIGGHAYGWVYPGPIGSVLDPAFIGLENTRDLPNASTFCGRCEAVCPMRIPLPKMLRYWREEDFERGLQPASQRLGVRAWAWLARRPRLYHAATGLAMGVLARLGRRKGRLARLPLAAGWTLYRDLPAPQGPTFHAEWRARKKGGTRVTAPGKGDVKRSAILGRVRASLGARPGDAARRAEVEDRLARHGRNTVPARAQGTPDRLRALFTSMLEDSRATVTAIASLDDLPEALLDYLRRQNLPQRLRLGEDPLWSAVDWSRAPNLERAIGPAEEPDQVGLAAAFSGIAETGTLMLLSGPANPTTNNFLPENHIVVVPASRLTGSYEDAWDALRRVEGPDAMPRTVNYISGPSRTGDIEQTLLLGAHGPRRLHVILVDDL